VPKVLSANRVVAYYVSLTERSRLTRAIVYFLTALPIILAIDLLCDVFPLSGWIWERLAGNVVEAVLLAIIGTYISQLREERLIRRNRQVQYLNHHVRNALSVIQAVELAVKDEQADALLRASHRIRTVLEQLSRDEELSIDDRKPANYE
jgi:ABC-type multidrug transport system fused ATPase/permease subunit